MKDLETEGYTVTVATKTGKITQINPKRKVAENALSAAKTLASEFGLSPASRARVAAMIAGIQKKDDFADFETVDEQALQHTPRNKLTLRSAPVLASAIDNLTMVFVLPGEIAPVL